MAKHERAEFIRKQRGREGAASPGLSSAGGENPQKAVAPATIYGGPMRGLNFSHVCNMRTITPGSTLMPNSPSFSPAPGCSLCCCVFLAAHRPNSILLWPKRGSHVRLCQLMCFVQNTACFQLQEVPLDYHGELRPVQGPTVRHEPSTRKEAEQRKSHFPMTHNGLPVYKDSYHIGPPSGEVGQWNGGLMHFLCVHITTIMLDSLMCI